MTNATATLHSIITAGVARYQDSLPDYARDVSPLITLPDHTRDASELPEPEPIITLNEETQRRLCLDCALPDCVGINNPRCPIRRKQRRVWRRKR